MFYKMEIGGFINQVFKSKGGIWFPELDHVIDRNFNVIAVKENMSGKLLIPAIQPELLSVDPQIILAHNIVGNCGDLHYAQRAAQETVTNSFAYTYMCTSLLAALAKTHTTSEFVIVGSSGKEQVATYPLTDDSDGDNTGAGVDIVTWLVSYTAADFNQVGITDGLIANSGDADVGGAVLLTGFTFASSFNKESTDTLKVFVNHTMNGV